MTWPASERYRLEAAPAGLALVQDLLNTLAAGKPREPDLLGDLTTAKNWIGEDLSTWARERDRPEPQVEINEHDLDELRVLRGELQDALRTPDRRGAEPALADLSALYSASAGLRMNRDSRVSIEPRGTGWRYIACLVLMEALEAQQTNVWNRLKICRNPRCSVAFFDRSRNNSGVWHSTRVCGNIENLRAHRARARAELPISVACRPASTVRHGRAEVGPLGHPHRNHFGSWATWVAATPPARGRSAGR